MEIKKNCEQCGNEFEIEYKKRYQRFCNRNCYDKTRKKPTYIKICKYCKKEFEVSFNTEKHHHPKFCSQRCVRNYLKMENHWHWKGVTRIKKCPICGKKFRARSVGKGLSTKFCSVKCARNSFDYKKRMSGKNSPTWKGGKEKGACYECGKKIEFYPSNAKYKLCSHECRAKFVGKLNDKRISINCSICGKIFLRRRDRINKVNFCSNKCMGEYWRKKMPWNEDDFIYNFFKGKLFGKNYKPNDLDEEIIRTRIRLFKIQRKEEQTDETNRV